MAYQVPSQQKAWIYYKYGAAKDVLTFRDDVPVPDISPDQVLVKVKAASLNPVDWKRRQGYFKDNDTELPHVPGYDMAGVIVKVGRDVRRYKVGDEVHANINENPVVRPKRFGTLAEYTAVEEKLLALKPRNLDFFQAAALPLSILTAQEAFEKARFQPGQSVFIVGGTGGVGHFAIQLAKHKYGASKVGATASTSKIDLIRCLGADSPVDYTKEDYWEQSEKYDFVFDTVGESCRAHRLLKPVVGLGATTVDFTNLPPGVFYFYVRSDGDLLARLTPLVESGRVKPVLDANCPYKFSDVVNAFLHLESGHTTGKVVVDIEY